jgi:hypothetical protein
MNLGRREGMLMNTCDFPINCYISNAQGKVISYLNNPAFSWWSFSGSQISIAVIQLF